MTPDPQPTEDGLLSALADTARGLQPRDPRAHVFYEERDDVRMTLASSGLRDIVATRTRGLVVAGRRSVHLTDPQFAGSSRNAPGTALPRAGSSRSVHEDWVADLEAMIIGSGNAAMEGRRHPFWSAKLVSFHQDVWVASPQTEILHDVRRGCRMEVRVQVGTRRPAHAVEEFVLHPGAPQAVSQGFARAFDRAERRVSISPWAPSGTATAIFAPGVAGVVAHELIGHALEGDVVARGGSWIQAATFPIGKAPVTVIDDPRRGRGAWAIDDEGVAVRETLLIDRGRAVGVLMDRSSARALGAESTGHGRRSSYLEAVRPRMGCTFIASGSDDPEETLRSTPRGVFIRRLAAGHTDPRSGRAAFVVSDADRVVDGRLGKPLDVFVMELDGLESWTSIDRVGRDLAFDTCIGSCVRDGQPLAVSVGAPTIRIGVVRVRS